MSFSEANSEAKSLAKAELRRLFREKRAAIPEIERLSQSLTVNRALAIFLAELIEARREQSTEPLRVCAYMAVGAELTLEPLLEDELSRAVEEKLLRFYIPKTRKEAAGHLALIFGDYESPATVGCNACQRGRLGIPEPREAMLDVNLEPDVVLLPCLAFDLHGQRLGQGAGCYDRYLGGLAAMGIRPLCVVVGFAEQKSLGALPTAPHDFVMDYYACGDTVQKFSSLGGEHDE